MPLTSAANTRQTGGINEADAYLLFRVADDAALNTEVTRMLTRASAWLKGHVVTASVYTGASTGDTTIDALFEAAEECLTLHFLFMPLKDRKVFGTHFPYDSEGSERYEELIDKEWFQEMEFFVHGYLNTQEDPSKSFALPVLGVTSTILNTELDRVTVTLGDVLDRAENRSPSQSGSFAFP